MVDTVVQAFPAYIFMSTMGVDGVRVSLLALGLSLTLSRMVVVVVLSAQKKITYTANSVGELRA